MIMYEELSAPIPDREKYLERIGYHGSTTLSQDTLSALVFAHQKSVPFENFDICELKRPITLDISSLYDKIVLRRRGGYCFEQNAVFTALMEAMGFEVWPVLARICRTPFGEQPMPPLHRVNLVCLDGEKYFTDVGFGGPMPAGALLLRENELQELQGVTYHFERRPHNTWLLLRQNSGGAVEPMLMFPESPSPLVDFIAPNFYCSNSPGSLFVVARMANIRSEDGFASITNTQFHLVRGDSDTTREIESKEDEAAILKEYFGIVLE